MTTLWTAVWKAMRRYVSLVEKDSYWPRILKCHRIHCLIVLAMHQYVPQHGTTKSYCVGDALLCPSSRDLLLSYCIGDA